MKDKKTERKRELILTNAKIVFIQKGFSSVTMKDIIEKCNISRGGIYLYFKSVDEIFMQVIIMHNNQKIISSLNTADNGKSFDTLINEYFDRQRFRLLNMHSSLLMAMHEYSFVHKNDDFKDFFFSQFLATKQIILSLLNYGVTQNKLASNIIEDLAVNIMFFIEGISTLAATSGISEELVDSQIRFVKDMIYSNISIKD
jgi:AcrR family transcriptional regulator